MVSFKKGQYTMILEVVKINRNRAKYLVFCFSLIVFLLALTPEAYSRKLLGRWRGRRSAVQSPQTVASPARETKKQNSSGRNNMPQRLAHQRQGFYGKRTSTKFIILPNAPASQLVEDHIKGGYEIEKIIGTTQDKVRVDLERIPSQGLPKYSLTGAEEALNSDKVNIGVKIGGRRIDYFTVNMGELRNLASGSSDNIFAAWAAQAMMEPRFGQIRPEAIIGDSEFVAQGNQLVDNMNLFFPDHSELFKNLRIYQIEEDTAFVITFNEDNLDFLFIGKKLLDSPDVLDHELSHVLYSRYTGVGATKLNSLYQENWSAWSKEMQANELFALSRQQLFAKKLGELTNRDHSDFINFLNKADGRHNEGTHPTVHVSNPDRIFWQYYESSVFK